MKNTDFLELDFKRRLVFSSLSEQWKQKNCSMTADELSSALSLQTSKTKYPAPLALATASERPRLPDKGLQTADSGNRRLGQNRLWDDLE